MKYTKCLSYPPSFYATQLITPSLNSWSSANHDKVKRLSANGEMIVSLMYVHRSFFLFYSLYSIEKQIRHIVLFIKELGFYRIFFRKYIKKKNNTFNAMYVPKKEI